LYTLTPATIAAAATIAAPAVSIRRRLLGRLRLRCFKEPFFLWLGHGCSVR
jgi:hypothetical protein